jgi:hypothetical protein
MNLIFFSRREGRTRSLNLSHPIALGVLGLVAFAVLGIAFSLGLQLGQRSPLAGGRAPLGQLARSRLSSRICASRCRIASTPSACASAS